MPWCEDCVRFFNPPSMGAAGECPNCGRIIAAPIKVPWHFKLLVGCASIYLGWRFVQGVGWVIQRLG